MSNYIKPVISLVSSEPLVASASSCSSSTADAEYVKEILEAMGVPSDQVFGTDESCETVFPIDGYCKFSSAIQVFNS